jgi:hypothetical protein
MNKNNCLLFCLVSLILVLGGCRPYGAPDIVEVAASQTAFVIPLDDGSEDQRQLKSVDYLEKKQVATKRISVPKRFRQTGYMYWNGEMIPTLRVIVVERKPVTREWKDISAEDRTSIGFSVEFTVVATIPENGAAVYLYNYNNKPLDEVMDQEIKSRISGRFVEECARRSLGELFTGKAEIMSIIRGHVIPYFREKGIEITNLDFKGNLTFESSDVQQAIDAVFTAAQRKKEQEDLNAAARAKAQTDREIAAQLSGPVALELKRLELRKIELENTKLWIEAWRHGGAKVPQYITGNQGNNFLIQTTPTNEQGK